MKSLLKSGLPMKMKNPAKVMVLGVISSDGQICPWSKITEEEVRVKLSVDSDLVWKKLLLLTKTILNKLYRADSRQIVF